MSADEHVPTDPVAEDWFADAQQALRNHELTLGADGKAVEVVVRATVPLDLGPIPASIQVVLTRTRHSNAVRLNNADGHVVFARSPNLESVTVDGRLASLFCETNSTVTVTGSVRRVVPVSSNVLFGAETRPDEIVLRGGTAVAPDGVPMYVGLDMELPDTAGLLVVAQSCTLTVSRRVRIELLSVQDKAIATLAGNSSLSIDRVYGTFKLKDLNVTVGDVATHLSVTVGGVVRPCRFEGQGQLTVTGTLISGLELDGPILNALPGSAFVHFSGSLRAGQCRNVTIRADAGTPFRFAGLNGSDPALLTGAALRNVLIDDDAEGPARVSELTMAAVVEPDVSRLRIYDWGLSWDWSRLREREAPLRLRRPSSDDARRDLEDAAFFAQELAALTEAKCGQGSLRTRASWAAYRGRNLTARSHFERTALSMFRFLGYGQRPGPPFVTWMVAVALGSVALQLLTRGTATLSSTGELMGVAGADWGFWESLGRLALSPFYLLRLAGDPELRAVHSAQDGLAIVLQTLVAVPFVFVGIAVSRLLRADWPGPSR